MAYSLDLRKKVVDFVSSGGRKKRARELFGVSIWCVNGKHLMNPIFF